MPISVHDESYFVSLPLWFEVNINTRSMWERVHKWLNQNQGTTIQQQGTPLSNWRKGEYWNQILFQTEIIVWNKIMQLSLKINGSLCNFRSLIALGFSSQLGLKIETSLFFFHSSKYLPRRLGVTSSSSLHVLPR